VGPQREVVAQLTRGEVPFIREQARVYFRDVQDHLIRTVEMVELYRDLVLGSRDIYLSSLSNRLNQIMKTLTIITVVAIPFTVITGFWGMNFKMPWFERMLASNVAFWGSTLVVFGLVGAVLFLFWSKGWVRQDDDAADDAAEPPRKAPRPYDQEQPATRSDEAEASPLAEAVPSEVARVAAPVAASNGSNGNGAAEGAAAKKDPHAHPLP
jgi:hypothetical protein